MNVCSINMDICSSPSVIYNSISRILSNILKSEYIPDDVTLNTLASMYTPANVLLENVLLTERYTSVVIYALRTSMILLILNKIMHSDVSEIVLSKIPEVYSSKDTDDDLKNINNNIHEILTYNTRESSDESTLENSIKCIPHVILSIISIRDYGYKMYYKYKSTDLLSDIVLLVPKNVSENVDAIREYLRANTSECILDKVYKKYVSVSDTTHPIRSSLLLYTLTETIHTLEEFITYTSRNKKINRGEYNKYMAKP